MYTVNSRYNEFQGIEKKVRYMEHCFNKEHKPIKFVKKKCKRTYYKLIFDIFSFHTYIIKRANVSVCKIKCNKHVFTSQ